MYFKIVEKFGPESGESWNEYIEWRKYALDRFDSVDSGLRPDLFEPQTSKDWDNCVNEDYKLNLITDLGFAKTVVSEFSNAEIVGVEFELDSPPDTEGLLGFDIIDSYCATSLLTNWGDDLGFINEKLGGNGLISNFADAKEVRDRLRSEFWEDSHADECSIWAIYHVVS